MRNLFARSRLFTAGVLILGLLLLLALLQPWINQLLIGNVDPISMGTFDTMAEPSREHLLGTDRWGRDWAALLVLATRYSLLIGFLSGVVATAIAVVLGFVSGYKGGRTDGVLRTFTDMVLVIPALPILIVVAAYIKFFSIPAMALLLALFSWAFGMRIIRSQVLSLRSHAYVDLAKMSNLNDAQIIFQELMPNLTPFIGVALATACSVAILAETGLELIGVGPGGDIITLGLMVNFAQQWGSLALGYYWLTFAPAIVLILIFVSMNLINMGLEETFNPRLKRVTGG